MKPRISVAQQDLQISSSMLASDAALKLPLLPMRFFLREGPDDFAKLPKRACGREFRPGVPLPCLDKSDGSLLLFCIERVLSERHFGACTGGVHDLPSTGLANGAPKKGA